MPVVKSRRYTRSGSFLCQTKLWDRQGLILASERGYHGPMMKEKMFFFCGLFWLLCPGTAGGEAGDVEAGLGPVYASTFRADQKAGVGLQIFLDVGLTDTLSVSAGAGWCSHFVGVGRAYVLRHTEIGLLYRIDILRIVPFAALKLGWLERDFEDRAADSGLSITAALGFDYLLTAYFSLGFAAEYHGLIDEWEAFPRYVAFTTRLGFRWSS